MQIHNSSKKPCLTFCQDKEWLIKSPKWHARCVLPSYQIQKFCFCYKFTKKITSVEVYVNRTMVDLTIAYISALEIMKISIKIGFYFFWKWVNRTYLFSLIVSMAWESDILSWVKMPILPFTSSITLGKSLTSGL